MRRLSGRRCRLSNDVVMRGIKNDVFKQLGDNRWRKRGLRSRGCWPNNDFVKKGIENEFVKQKFDNNGWTI